MMAGRLVKKLLAPRPPAWLRKVEAVLLTDVFATAFDVEAPSLRGLSANEALAVFREFTAVCMEAALVDERAAAGYRMRLGECARAFGAKARRKTNVDESCVFEVVRYLYRGIGIELEGAAPGELKFGPCSFAQRYTPGCCWLMSAFDEGFICGYVGLDGPLEFSCRLTEGAPCCRARIR